MNHPYTSYTSTEDSTLTLGTLLETMRKLGPRPPRIVDVIYDACCVTDETVQRSFKERFLSWPWQPWRKTKIVVKPAMYFVDYLRPEADLRRRWSVSCDKVLIAHPSLREEIDKMLEEQK